MERILIVDDDTYICKLLLNFLKKKGYQADAAYTGASALSLLDEKDYQLVISDFRLPDKDGFDILYRAREKNPSPPVVIITAYEDLSTAIRLIRQGAYDYITKPLIPEEVMGLVREVLSSELPEESGPSFEKDFIRGNSPGFQEVMDHVSIVAPVDMNVIIQGETGSGKEYVARSIHFNSQRKEGPFIAVDCGALPKGLVNSELFGHVKGSFTGATYDKAGLFEQSSGGTLFLDELSNLDAENQIKLLRVLQESKITRVGDAKNIHVDVRLVVASNEDLRKEVESNNLREDLYHRLNEFKIMLPSLRERGDDIILFATEFLERAAKRFNKEVTGFDEDVRELLMGYHWPGNIRELKNVMNRSVLLAKSRTVSLREFPEEVRTQHALEKHAAGSTDLKGASREAEKEAIVRALVSSGYNKSQAARILNIDRKTLYNKIEKFNISLNKP